METVEIEVSTTERQVVDLTASARSFCQGKGDGLLNVLAPHATAGVALMETGSGSEIDLVLTLERLLPRDFAYRHRHGSAGHGADHVLPALLGPSVTLPVVEGRLVLGTWQSLVLVDLNPDNPHRRVRLSFIGG